jgi:hypothetical protein
MTTEKETPPRSEVHDGAKMENDDNPTITRNGRAVQFVASFDTGQCSQVRMHLVDWRGSMKLELQTYTATVPQVWMACGPPVSLSVEHFSDLVNALMKARAML